MIVLLPLLLALGAGGAPRQAGVPVGRGTELPRVSITSPPGGWSAGRMLLVEGTVSDPTVDPVVLSLNGDRYLMRTAHGRFSRSFPAARGKNVLTVSATNRAGTGSAQASTFAQVPAVPLKAVLTSDTDGVYTDLHIYEPSNGSQVGARLETRKMAHVFWADTESPSGGTFFLNEQQGDFDQPGYGPYLYLHRAPPHGVFAIAANYWPSGDKAQTLATLNLTLFEGTPQEMRRRVQIVLATPGTTKVLAWVNVLGDGRALIFAPATDRWPTDPAWPTNLGEAAEALAKPSEDSGI